MNARERKKIHSDYCAYSGSCDKEHDCKTGAFCDAYEPRYKTLDKHHMIDANDLKAEFEARLMEGQ